MAITLMSISIPEYPGELEWGSPSHIASTTQAQGRVLGRSLLLLPDALPRSDYFSLSLHLPRESSPAALATAMALSTALTLPVVREYAGGVISAILEDGATPGNSLESLLQDIYIKAQGHHDEAELPGTITALSFLAGMERVAWENFERFPHLREAMEQDLYRGQPADLTLEERSRELPYMELLAKRARRDSMYFEELVIKPFTSPAALEGFHGEYWREMNSYYIGYLRDMTYSIYKLFSDVELLCIKPPRSVAAYKRRVGEGGAEALSAWGAPDGIPTTKELREASALPQQLMRLTAALQRSHHAPLEENLTRVNVDMLIALNAMVEEYNMEWALASFPWEEHPPAPPGELITLRDLPSGEEDE